MDSRAAGEPWTRSDAALVAPSSAVSPVAAAAVAGPNLTYDAHRGLYMLSAAAKNALQPLFSHFGYDVSQATFSIVPAWRVANNGGYTVGNDVMFNRSTWVAISPHAQLGLLAHELTHSVQYERLGIANFLMRYVREWPSQDNYNVPPSLRSIPITNLNPTDKRFTLDQLANRVKQMVP